jgi:MOSC domain-containing protein YiiM
MLTFDELERRWAAMPPAPRNRGMLRHLVRRLGDGAHDEPAAVTLSVEHGLVGDRWSAGATPDPDSQVTVMSRAVAALIGEGVQPLHLPGDNLLVELDLGEDALPAGSRLRVGDALLEVTAKPHLGCEKFAARFGRDALRWVNATAHRARRLRGVNCRVVSGGTVAVGDVVERV